LAACEFAWGATFGTAVSVIVWKDFSNNFEIT
jgi:hypothetical protein